jgi:hypothetical protein
MFLRNELTAYEKTEREQCTLSCPKLTEYGWTDPESTGTEIGTRHQFLQAPGQCCWLSLTRLGADFLKLRPVTLRPKQ